MPGRVDSRVRDLGETVTHEFVTDYALTAEGQVDPASVTTDTQDLPAIVSQPSEEATQRFEGRLSDGAFQLTVESDQDVQGDRGGRRDRFEVRGEWYVVVEVQSDEHPFTDTAKQTVLVDRLGGRGDG